MTVALIVRPSAAAAVREEIESAEAFDAWADREFDGYDNWVSAWARGPVDDSPLPRCAFVGSESVTDDMHSYVDTVRQWMECVGCGRVEVRDDFL